MPGSYRSAAISIYKHIQSTPSTTWTIVHKINTNHPVVDCFINLDSSVYQAIPVSVITNVAGTTIVTWSSPQSGYATAA